VRRCYHGGVKKGLSLLLICENGKAWKEGREIGRYDFVGKEGEKGRVRWLLIVLMKKGSGDVGLRWEKSARNNSSQITSGKERDRRDKEKNTSFSSPAGGERKDREGKQTRLSARKGGGKKLKETAALQLKRGARAFMGKKEGRWERGRPKIRLVREG